MKNPGTTKDASKPEPSISLGLQYWRERIYFSLSLALVILGTIAYVPSMWLSIAHKLWPVAILDTFAYGLVLGIFFFKKAAFHLRASGLLFVVYTLGVSLLYLLGPIGAGLVWLFAFPVLAGILLSFRSALISIFINIITVLSFGILLSAGFLENTLMVKYDVQAWIIVSINFICLNGIVAFPIAVLMKGLEKTLEEERKAKSLLKIERKKLILKNADLTRTNTDLDNFIYTASHDLKSPLSNIEGLVNSLKDELKNVDDKEVNTIMGLINKSVDKFKNTIKDLTEISKIQKNAYDDDNAPVNLNELLDDVKFSLNALIKENNPKITSNFQVDTIPFSKKNLRSIFYNLLSNAIKYRSPDRPCEIQLQTQKSGNYILLSVKDNGLGMGLDHKTKIFRMFKRMHDHVEGSGVGLYIVKRIIDNHEGHIEVESEIGKGSLFKVYFKKI